jgi:DNA-binding HxlR family transcriptional regulator
MQFMTTRSYKQLCGIAYALDLVGERWTLLIIRELMPGPRRFTDLMEGLPGISTNLLSGRLKRLEQQGLVRRRELPPPAASTVYELTGMGRTLEPMLLELGKWGSQFVPEQPTGDALLHAGSYALTLKTFFDPEKARGLHETYELRVAGDVLSVRIDDGEIDVWQGEARDPDMVLHADMPAYMALLLGRLQPEEALAGGHVRVEGDANSLSRFLDLCGVPPLEERV